MSFFLGGTKMKKSDNSCVNIIDINLFSERCTVPVHKLFYIVFLLCFLIVFTGCEFFNRPMIDFVEEWTNTAQIGKHSLDGSYPETGGMVNLPSGSDRVITYYVANPQNYDLGIEVTFDPNLPGWDPIRTSNHPDFSTTSNQGTVEQDPTDKSIIRLTLNENALASLDGTGSTLNPTISIVEPNSGRNFGSYTVPLRVNSAPSKAKNAVIMTWHDGTVYNYAVLFYLPADINNLYSPDRDVVSMTVSGFSGLYNKTFEIPASGDIGGVENSYDQSKFSAIVDQFIPLSGYRFVGVITDLPVGSVEPSCTVTLTDKWGLESSVAVSTSATTLTEIYVDPAAGDDGNPGSDVLPVKTIEKALEKLSGMTNTTIILMDDINVQNTLAFTASYPNITLKGGATPVTLTYSGTGRAITVSGGKLTLGENITITGADDGAVEITGGEFVMETGSTIRGNKSYNGGGVLIVLGTFTMEGGTISGNTATGSGGGVYVDGGIFTMSGTAAIQGNEAGADGGGVCLSTASTFTMSGGTIDDDIYADTSFTLTGSPAVSNCTITLGPHTSSFDVSGLSTSAGFTDVLINLSATYTENEVLLENARSKDICGKFSLGNPPSNGVWWIGLDDAGQNGILRHIDGTLSGGTVTVTTPPTDNAGLQDLVNDSADGGYKVEITGGGNVTVDSTVSVPGGADVAIKPGNSNTVNINADGETTVFDVQEGGSLTLGGGYGVVNVTGDPTASSPTADGKEISLINISRGGTVTIADNANIQNNIAGRGVTVTDGKLIMTGGSIKDNTGGYNYGSGVYVSGQNASFKMSGGEISGNTLKLNSNTLRQGAGVMVCNGATFTLSNKGEITGNSGYEGVGVTVSGSTFTMNGGEISGNNGSGTSGGVYLISGSTMNMNGGKITRNGAAKTRNGEGAGGVFIGLSCTFTGSTDFTTASITENYVANTNVDVYFQTGGNGAYSPGNVQVGNPQNP